MKKKEKGGKKEKERDWSKVEGKKGGGEGRGGIRWEKMAINTKNESASKHLN